MESMTIDELATMMAAEFGRVYKWFDRLEKRVMRVEEICEDHTGRFIGIEDRLSKVEYRLEGVEREIKGASPKLLKKRIEKLEKQSFGGIQPA